VIPLRDTVPTRTTPVVVRAIVIANAAVYLLTAGHPEAAIDALGAVASHFTGLEPRLPAGFEGSPIPPGAFPWYRAITHMFVHGGLFHLIGNLWFLWVFGDNVEDRLGRVRFAVFYLLCGLAALASQVIAAPASGIPMVGASGAIAGVLGAYLRLYPSARVITLVPFGFLPVILTLSARFFLWAWMAFQVASGILSPDGPGVAWWAHIGGFACGMVLVGVMAPKRPRAKIEIIDMPPRQQR